MIFTLQVAGYRLLPPDDYTQEEGMRECNIAKNKKRCNCSYEPCSRKGICCECIVYHQNNGEIPACFFPDNIEKTYDRSIANFIRVYQKEISEKV